VSPGLLVSAAALLLALLGLGPSFAADPHPRLAALPDNTAVDLGPYRCNAPADDPHDCGSITDYSGFAYDRSTHQLLMFGGGHAATHRTDVDAFSFETLTWKSAYPSTLCRDMRLKNLGLARGEWLTTGHPVARHTYDMLVMADNVKRLVLLGHVSGQGYCVEDSPPGRDVYFFNGKIALYDPVAKVWSYSSASNDGWQDYGTAEYDPETGLVIVVDQESIWTFDPVTHAKEKRGSHESSVMGYAKNLVYYPPGRKMYYIADGAAIFELSLGTGRRPRLSLGHVGGITGAVPKLPETGFAYDSVNRVIGGGVVDGMFHVYDPARKTWERLVMNTIPPGASVGTGAFHALAYNPVDNVFIFVTDRASGRRTWAYRYRGSAPGSPAPAGPAAPTR
jgi:hypothetical protein